MRSVAASALLLLAALTACRSAEGDLALGPWRGWLDSPGGELPFELEFREGETGLAASVINGAERLEPTAIEQRGNAVTVSFAHYDSSIEATVSADGRRLDGRWDKTGAGGKTSGLDFHAVAGEHPRFGAGPTPSAEIVEAIAGRWAVDFESSDDPAVGEFETHPDGRVLGTFMTTTGDYRYLAGGVDDNVLRLSCFDGAHAFLFHAELRDDGSLAGDFWSRDSWHERWTASKDPDAALPDAFELTRWVQEVDLGDLVYPDLDGSRHSLADPAFAGRARIIEIFGSWCPNCNDASRLLVELDGKYRGDGLSILGLAFEVTGDFERDAEQVRVYAAHHGIDFPLLIAGVSDKAEASKSMPLIDRVRSYPTTIFLHGDGRVRAVHQGYTGPATGAAHEDLRERFEALVRELLAGDGGEG